MIILTIHIQLSYHRGLPCLYAENLNKAYFSPPFFFQKTALRSSLELAKISVVQDVTTHDSRTQESTGDDIFPFKRYQDPTPFHSKTSINLQYTLGYPVPILYSQLISGKLTETGTGGVSQVLFLEITYESYDYFILSDLLLNFSKTS